jgi:Ca2+-binding EF-hand superfamily protein
MNPGLATPRAICWLFGLMAASLVAAQEPAAPAPESCTASAYDESMSRRLFACCDEDGDLRLDLFEARACLQAMGDPSRPEWFRRLDQDRDGFLEWPEFDRHFRAVVRAGDSLRLRLVRPLPAAKDETEQGRPTSPLAVFDANEDGLLEADEAKALFQSLDVPESMLGLLAMFDADKDGKYSEQELNVPLQQFRTPAAARGEAGSLPAAMAAMDADANFAIDVFELARALRKVDPELQRWAPQILAARDRNRDGLLRTDELPTEVRRGSNAVVDRAKVR